MFRHPRPPGSPGTGLLARFRRDKAGSLVLWFGLALVPLLFAVGAGLDYGRAVNLKTQLQGAVDAAALAGASAYTGASAATTAQSVATTYMNNFITAMGSANGITYTVSLGSKTSGSTATLYSVTVTARGSLNNAIMSMTTAKTGVGVSATAKSPVYTIVMTLSSFSSSAADANTIYYYIVNADGSVPAATDLNQFFTNNGINSSTLIKVQLTASQKLGFALKNITGGRSFLGYGFNGYGGFFLSTHMFYSHLYPPSITAYPTVNRNCSLQVTTSAAAVTSGSCSTSLPAYSAINCATAAGKTLIYSWNDMGGPIDDKDYDDMVYTVQCNQNDPSLGDGVVLTN